MLGQSLKQGVTGGLPADFDGFLSHLWPVINEGEIEPLGELLAQALFFMPIEGPSCCMGWKSAQEDNTWVSKPGSSVLGQGITTV